LAYCLSEEKWKAIIPHITAAEIITGLDFLKWLNSSAITTAYARTNTIRLKMPTYDVVRSISIVLN
jgi:hypothetical protein